MLHALWNNSVSPSHINRAHGSVLSALQNQYGVIHCESSTLADANDMLTSWCSIGQHIFYRTISNGKAAKAYAARILWRDGDHAVVDWYYGNMYAPARDKPKESFIPIHRCAAAFDAQRNRLLTKGEKVCYLFD